MHPLARPDNKTSISERPGFDVINSGDRVIMRDGRRGTADEFLRDGTAYVTFDDGSSWTVSSAQLGREPGPPEDVAHLVTDDIRWPQDFRWDKGVYERIREPYQ